jgi:hypothetical protein
LCSGLLLIGVVVAMEILGVSRPIIGGPKVVYEKLLEIGPALKVVLTQPCPACGVIATQPDIQLGLTHGYHISMMKLRPIYE